jgi:hypothetical protein
MCRAAFVLYPVINGFGDFDPNFVPPMSPFFLRETLISCADTLAVCP